MKYPAEFTAEINGFLSQPGWGHRAWRSRLFCAASFAVKFEALSPDVTAGSLMQLRHSPEWPEVRVSVLSPVTTRVRSSVSSATLRPVTKPVSE
jgi:hypothetical protein